MLNPGPPSLKFFLDDNYLKAGDSMSNQSLLPLFRMTHLRFHSNCRPYMPLPMHIETVPNFRTIGLVFFELTRSQKL